ncbi:MAG TPA: flagellar biosynthesis protein FlhF [Terriglobia bacterium]|nr:flagellar biosynthesis protein FlhF [Terriglobia bacterium]
MKTYKTHSLHEGLEDIKRDLGSEALILSTRSVSVRPPYSLFKKPAWEITAALEEKPAVVAPPPPAPAPKPKIVTAPKSTAAAVAVAPARIIQKDPRMEELIGEIGELKKSLRSLSKAIPAKSENGGGLFAELVTNGIDHDWADHLITTASRGNPAPSELRERVRRLLADQLIIAPPVELRAKTRIVSAFVGPTGVGKTTTIAKIAGHAAIRMKKKVAMISTDMFRIGGQEQLSRLGELLGIPTYGCADVSTLKDLVASLDDRNLILIDTPGSSPSDLARLSKLETVTSAADAKVHLVISATTRSEDITKIVTRFQRFSPTSVIFTKIDETDSKGPLAGDLLRNELPVSYLTNGQRVPEDLLIPSADELARYVLPVEPVI